MVIKLAFYTCFRYLTDSKRYKEQEDAEEAQAAMDGCEFNGKNISVTFAQGDRKCNLMSVYTEKLNKQK